MRYLKEMNLGIQGVLADPEGSIIGGGFHGCYEIEGIGNGFIPTTMDLALIDQSIKVCDRQAFEMVREIARKTGLFVGSSSGANLAAAIELAKSIDHGTIVTIFYDRGERYLSKNIFD
jgi:cysteine synthase A